MSGDAVHAHSALFVLARAIVEARSGRAAEVEPDHLLVGMGTLCGPDLPQILARGQQEPALRRSIEADAQRVTECFARAGISPHRLRRSLRAALAVEGGAGGGERQLSRTARRAFRRDQRLPDKAIDALDHACAASRIRTLSPDAAPEPALRIGRDEVAAVVAERARLPLQQVARGEAERLLAMEEQLRRRVVGQEEAVRAVAEAVRTGREGAPPAGPGPADPAHRPILDALRQYFRPELLGRIGRIVVFSPLSEADLRPILDRILDRVHARLATRAITLTLTPAGRALLLRHGTDRRAGARFLEQAVDRLLVQPLARALLTGDIPDGSTVRVDAAVRRCP
ncbi:hypothetical protein [Streptomyces sp. NPDC054854]